MHTEFVSYVDGNEECEGYLASPIGLDRKTPVILVCHAWAGQDSFARERAEEFADLGYIGFAIDVYGKGRRGSSPEENTKLMMPFVEDRALLRRRLLAAVNTVKHVPMGDPQRIGAIGFCFGGLCALDIARAAPQGVRGIVAFHGLFTPPSPAQVGSPSRITASVLALHGYDDPMCTPDAVVGLAKELTDGGADWEIDMFGHTSHAFTNPQANDPVRGLMYKKRTSDRAFAKMRAFFAEVFPIG
ncbi:MAG: dienelactone hydrolase family protein [Phycisphaerae bacterium]|nr:dienelactone hydrolase family protein [Phycisphaerae bacterium]